MSGFLGFIRSDGQVGIRNHVLVLPTVSCANGTVNMIRELLPDVTAVFHCHGCGRAGKDLEIHMRTLVNIGKNPNVSAVCVIGLGCEVIKAHWIASGISASGKPVEALEIQQEGGSKSTAEKAVSICREFLKLAEKEKRVPAGFADIMLGLECGGSDAFSGITANPAVGLVSDWLISEGGTVILTENTEMIGTGHILSRRAVDAEVACRVENVIVEAEERTKHILGPMASMVIAPGNMDGGMTTIQEKSLGCITKAGSAPINEVVDYGVPPSKKGLIIMDGPGYDTESMAGLAAAGVQVMLFTTGRGTPAGFPCVPVIKIVSNSPAFKKMEDDFDVNAGTLLEAETLEDISARIIDRLVSVLNGEKTRAELNSRDGVICLYTSLPSF